MNNLSLRITAAFERNEPTLATFYRRSTLVHNSLSASTYSYSIIRLTLHSINIRDPAQNATYQTNLCRFLVRKVSFMELVL